MTQDEQKAELGGMVMERRELRLTIPCLEERLKKARKALAEKAAAALVLAPHPIAHSAANHVRSFSAAC